MPEVRCVAIVDPLDAGVLLAPALSAKGVVTILVPGRDGQDADGFTHHLPWSPDPQNGLKPLRNLGVDLIIPGSEQAVMVADWLSEQLGLPGNGVELSTARRDKHRMHAVAASHGVRVPRQVLAENLTQVLDFANSHWPVIIKPQQAKGGDGVHYCTNGQEAARAFHALYGHRDVMGAMNCAVLVQEFISGPEYVVDTVSLDGVHRPSTLWTYGKGAPGFDSAGQFTTKTLLPPDHPLAPLLFTFAWGVLDALGIGQGAGHCEIRMGQDGPVLIEMAARLHGGPLAHELARTATGYSQCDLWVDAITDPAAFLAGRTGEPDPPRAACMVLLRRPPPLGVLEHLSSLDRLFWNDPRPAPPAVAGLATLIGDDAGMVAADMAVAAGEVTCTLLNDPAAIAALRPVWLSLLAQSSCNRAFAGPVWYQAALTARPHLSPRLLTVWRRGELVGLLPLVQEGEGPARFASNLSDYNDAVVVLGDRAAAHALMAHARAWFPALELDCVRPDAACRITDAPLTDPTVDCPFADLSGGYDVWWAGRSASFREKLTRTQRKAAAAGLIVDALKPDEWSLAADLFLSLHADRFGDRSLFNRFPWAADFVRAALPGLLADGAAHVVTLRSGGEITGMCLCMVGDDHLGYWNAGFRAVMEPLSPGVLMLHAALGEAAARGLAEFDLLRGLEAYKDRWATGRRRIGRLP
ncbi:GNAT family N-acetyltransferase [Niveispirillum cyanobacteriorum]|nr:GNAT family N-acetyltransferase [Niveispirillum cyanobacteriorum]